MAIISAKGAAQVLCAICREYVFIFVCYAMGDVENLEASYASAFSKSKYELCDIRAASFKLPVSEVLLHRRKHAILRVETSDFCFRETSHVNA